jgi:uncharacterized protein YjbI with pentapeptide repeats
MTAETGSSSAGPEELSSRVPSWLVVFAAFVGAVVGVIVARLVLLGLTGRFGFAGKTVWDYLDVFLVPVAVALATVWFTLWENTRQRKLQAVQQHLQLEVEKQRAQDAALQAYLDQMSELLADKERPLHTAQPGDSLGAIARARTLTVLTRLDGLRKGSVLRFSYESALIIKERSTLSLRGADLSDAYRGEGDVTADVPVPPTPSGRFSTPYEARERLLATVELLNRAVVLGGRNLRNANLCGVNLSGAYLKAAFLDGADLREAYLSNADLSRADLTDANLNGANLKGANLQEARLRKASLEGAILDGANLEKAYLEEARLEGAYLQGANLQEAQLQKAHLKGTVLVEANLGTANLQEAHMEGLFLGGANLGGATGVTNEELEQLAHSPASLQGTTMPDRSKHP